MGIAHTRRMCSTTSVAVFLPMACLGLAALAGAVPAQQFETLQQTNVLGSFHPAGLGADFPVDVDADGDLDVLLRSGTVLRNQGDLVYFVEPHGASIPVGPLGLPLGFDAAADVDGDGIVDVVRMAIDLLANQTRVEVGHGLPGGRWSAMQTVGSAVGFLPLVGVVDVDGDGSLDLFCAQAFASNQAVLLHNDGTGHFTDVTTTQLPAGLSARLVAFADLDGDGDRDLVCGSAGQPMQVLRNDGTGRFSVVPGNALPTLAALWQLRLGDLDADGDADLLVATYDGQPMRLFTNNGTGVFAAVVPPAPLPADVASDLAFRDLDGDGRADLLLVTNSANGLVLQALHHAGGAVFTPRPATLVGHDTSLSLSLADLDGDGDLDVVLGGTLLFLDDGGQHYQPLRRPAAALVDVDSADGAMAAGDLDGDGIVDLLAGGSVLRGEGDGHFGVPQSLAAEMSSAVLFDADADGDLDIAFGNPNGGGLLLQQAGGFAAAPAFPASAVASDVITADFDGDGLADLLSMSGVLLLNSGGGNFAIGPSLPVLPGSQLQHAVAADFDGDGRIDLVVSDGVGWRLLRNTAGLVFQAIASQAQVGVLALAAADVDADGDVDLAVGVSQGGFGGVNHRVDLWENRPAGWSIAASVFTSEPSRSLVFADVDGDGDLDLLAGDLIDNASNLVFGVAQALAGGLHAVADLDGDGDVDVAGLAARTVVVQLNRHRQLAVVRQPRLGGGYPIEVSSRPGYGSPTLVQLALGFALIPVQPLGSLGLLHIDPATAFLGPIGTTGADGRCAFALQVPLDPLLAGVDVYWQGIVGEPGGARLTGYLHDRVLR